MWTEGIFSPQFTLFITEKPKNKKEAHSNVLFDFIDRYIQDHSKTREPGSLIVYKSLKNHLQAYQQETKKKITFDKIDYSFFQSFQNFLIGRTKTVHGRSVPMLNPGTASNY